MPKKEINRKMKYAVDIPTDETDEWICIEYFYTKKEAIKFVREKFGADESGKISLISNL